MTTLGSALSDLLIHTVSIEAASSRDNYGDITFAAAASWPARVETSHKLVVDRTGRETVAATVVYIGPNAAGSLPGATVDSRITLPDGSTPPILAVDRNSDEAEADHEVVYCDRVRR